MGLESKIWVDICQDLSDCGEHLLSVPKGYRLVRQVLWKKIETREHKHSDDRKSVTCWDRTVYEPQWCLRLEKLIKQDKTVVRRYYNTLSRVEMKAIGKLLSKQGSQGGQPDGVNLS
jgi:hypothetical protein